MNLLGLIQFFLILLATKLYFTAKIAGPYLTPFVVCLVTIRFIFQRHNSMKMKISHILQHKFQQRSSYNRKIKGKPNLNIFETVLMDSMFHRYREWANPVWYFWATTSKSGNKDFEDSESNSDEESSHDENEDGVENETKTDEIDDSLTCITTTKEVFDRLPDLQISQKRKAESESIKTSKRSKTTGSLENAEENNQTETMTEASINASSEKSISYRNEETSPISDLQSTHNVGECPQSERIQELPKIDYESLPPEKSETFRPPSKDEKPVVEDLLQSDSSDKSSKPFGRECFSSSDKALKNTVPVIQTMRKEMKSTQTETEKIYPNPKKTWKNQVQDELCNTPSDPRIRRRETVETFRRVNENQSFRDNTLACQEMAPASNTKTCDTEKHTKSSTDSTQNILISHHIFPEINFSSLLIEQTRQRIFVPFSFDVGEEISEIVRKFFENYRNANERETEVNVPLECPSIHPCSSTAENVKDERSKVKSYPGLSLQPQKVKKDARYQKKFYRERKEITLPKKLGDVIQWVANKPRNEVNIPVSDSLSSDEKDLPIDKYYEKAQALTHNFMRMFDSAKEQKARKKLYKKNRKERKEKIRRGNTGYYESSFKEESPSSESSDSLPTSGESPVKETTPSVLRPKIPSDFDISRVEISPLKPVAKVSPRFPYQQERLCQVPPSAVNVKHLSDDENICDVPPLSDPVSREVSNSRVGIRDISWCPVPWADIGKCLNQNQWESPLNPPQEAQMTRDASNFCPGKQEGCARETVIRKTPENESPTYWTESTLKKYTTVRKIPETFNPDPTTFASEQQGSSGAHEITAERGEPVNLGTNPSSSAEEKYPESLQNIYDTAYKLVSTIEKYNLISTDLLRLDPEISDLDSLTSVSSNLESTSSESSNSESSHPASSNPENSNTESSNQETQKPETSDP